MEEDDTPWWKGFWGYVMLLLGAGAIAAGLYFAFRPQFSPSKNTVSDQVGAVISRYSDALKIAMQFFDVQKAGKLQNNKIEWRGDSALYDGNEAELNLSKGMYDAGDHMKFGFPMAYTATILSWTILEYGDQMEAVHQLEPAKANVRWITDYLIDAHPDENTLYIQVGDPEIDHKCWDRPENMSSERPLTKVNATKPGTEVAAETAAALAAASLVFKTDVSHASTLLKHAKQLFNFANKYRGVYSVYFPKVAKYYNSTGFGDELLWAASWLYHATKDTVYLDFIRDNGVEFANFNSLTWFTWDNKAAGTQVLLSRLAFFAGNDKIPPDTGINRFKETAEVFMCGLLPDSPLASTSRTPGGIILVTEGNSLLHTVAAAFLAVIYSDYLLTSKTTAFSCKDKHFRPSDLRNFAINQVNYIIGGNPMNMSYLVGYGDKYPQFVHHRGASIPADAKTGCEDGFKWYNSTEPNPNIATGALVGGPFLDDTYTDARNNSQSQPFVYNSALAVGLLSGLVTTSSVVKSFK